MPEITVEIRPTSGFRRKCIITFISTVLLKSATSTTLFTQSGIKQGEDDWQMLNFEKQDAANPILGPLNTTTFYCPIRKDTLNWEAKDLFNPTAFVRDGKIHLLYRAEDFEGEYMGTSRIGLATSEDGINFQREAEPIFYPNNDAFIDYEWEGGVEDPRIVETIDGMYVMTYTGYNGSMANLMVATTRDLRVWTKHGLAFKNTDGHLLMWSKAGSIVTTLEGNKFITKMINGYYWMYWHWRDQDIALAKSIDLLLWTPITEEGSEELRAVLTIRPGKFDSDLVESGPQAVLRDDGIFLIYNGRNRADDGDINLPEGTYSAGQVLFDKDKPEVVLKRSENYFMTPDKDYEQTGQINNVVFLEGLVCYKGKWFLYYGTADSFIAVATTTDKYCDDGTTTTESDMETTTNGARGAIPLVKFLHYSQIIVSTILPFVYTWKFIGPV